MRKRRGTSTGRKRRRLTAEKSVIVRRIRSLSHQAAKARLEGNIGRAIQLERRRDFNYNLAEFERITGAASRAEEEGQDLAERAHSRKEYGRSR